MNITLKVWLKDQARALQFYGIMRLISVIIMGIILVKLAYPIAGISQFELYMFSAASLSFFISTAINKSIITNDRDKSDVPIIGLALITISLSAILSLILFRYNPDINGLSLFLLLLSIPIANNLEYFLLVKEKIKSIYIWGAILPVCWILFFSYMAYNQWTIQSIVSALIIFNLFKSAIAFLNIHRNKNIDWTYSFLLYKDFIGIALLSGLMDYIDGYAIEWLYPDFEFSIFRYGARELPLIALVITSVSNGFVLSIRRQEDNWQSIMKARISSLIKWIFPLISILFFISPWVFTTVFSTEYIESAKFFNIYLLLILFRIMIGQSILMARLENSFLLKLSLIEVLLNISLSIILSYSMGIYGILWATVISYFVQKIYLIYFIESKLKISTNSFFPIKNYIMHASIVLIAFIVSSLIQV